MNDLFPMALPKGSILAGQYIIEEVLGQGGFGITYRATDHKTGQKVAVKEFFPDTLATRTASVSVSAFGGERGESFDYGLKCFLYEAQTLAEFIGNENIIKIHKYFEENGTAYFVMDFVEGISFDKYIKQKGGKIPYEEAEDILMHVIDALAAVHSKGIVHRDVTPDNIYLTNDGKVYLLDFGAARYSLGDKSRSLDVVLKHGFAPKEQYTRRGKQGPYTDVYALGATFYYSITGKRLSDSIDRLDEDDLIPPSNLGVSIPKTKEDALLKALEVQPSDRYQTMDEFKSDLMSITQTESSNNQDNDDAKHTIALESQKIDDDKLSEQFNNPTVPYTTNEPASVMAPSNVEAPSASTATSTKTKSKTGLIVALSAVLLVLVGIVVGGALLMPRLNNNDEVASSKSNRNKKPSDEDDDDEEDDDIASESDEENTNEDAVTNTPEEDVTTIPEEPTQVTEETRTISPNINATDGGAELNIYAWNNEVADHVANYCPGYVYIDDCTGYFNNTKVNWIIIPIDDYSYRNNLDGALQWNSSASPSDKIDLFLVEPEYMDYYLDTNYTLALTDIGLLESDFSDNFQFSIDMGTDSNGYLKAVTYQNCVGVLIYNKSIAKKVLGSDDPATVQSYVSDWDSFMDTAGKMANSKYYMTASVYDTLRAYTDNQGKNPGINAWAADSKELLRLNASTKADMWGDDWGNGLYNNKVFCYFGPTWFYEYCMYKDDSGSIASNGGWAVCEGPAPFIWGGSFICVAAGTDNVSLCAEFVKTLATDTDFMYGVARNENISVNSKTVLNNSNLSSSVLGGQDASKAIYNNSISLRIKKPYVGYPYDINIDDF